MRQSWPGNTVLLSVSAASGTVKARAGVRTIRPANSALAANGHRPGTWGKSRAATSKAMRNATSSRSIPNTRASLVAISLSRSDLPRTYHGGGPPFHPAIHDGDERVEAVSQRGGAGLKNDRRFDLAQEPGLDR